MCTKFPLLFFDILLKTILSILRLIKTLDVKIVSMIHFITAHGQKRFRKTLIIEMRQEEKIVSKGVLLLYRFFKSMFNVKLFFPPKVSLP